MMTGIERMTNILDHKPVDRIGLFEHFWNDTSAAWVADGKIKANETFSDIFGHDMDLCSGINFTANLDFVPEVVAETEDTITIKDGNYAILKKHKHHDTTPEHVNYTIKTYEDWNEKIKPLLIPSERRINFEYYNRIKNNCAKGNKMFGLASVNVFEAIHPVCGHEEMLVGMALEPEWITDMANTYADFIIGMQEIAFSKGGKPDVIWYYEDMGYKMSPFMSPAMYREFILPAHKKTIDFAKSQGLKTIMHSCGFVDPLLPGMIEAGIDMLQVIEVKAGMDLLKLHKQYGDVLSFMGGIDVRALYSNDKATIDKELESKIPYVKQGFNYALHSDHSIPKTVTYDSYKYFVEKGLELGTY